MSGPAPLTTGTAPLTTGAAPLTATETEEAKEAEASRSLLCLNDNEIDIILDCLDFASSIHAALTCTRMKARSLACWKRATYRWVDALPKRAAMVLTAYAWTMKPMAARVACPITRRAQCSCTASSNTVGTLRTPAGITAVHVSTFYSGGAMITNGLHADAEGVDPLITLPRRTGDTWEPTTWLMRSIVLDPDSYVFRGNVAVLRPNGDLLSMTVVPRKRETPGRIFDMGAWVLPHYQRKPPSSDKMRDLFGFKTVHIEHGDRKAKRARIS